MLMKFYSQTTHFGYESVGYKPDLNSSIFFRCREYFLSVNSGSLVQLLAHLEWESNGELCFWISEYNVVQEDAFYLSKNLKNVVNKWQLYIDK